MYELSKDRYLELKHHCAQYNRWKGELMDIIIKHLFDPTGETAARRKWLHDQLQPIDETLSEVFEKGGYAYRKTREAIITGSKPEVETERYRKFFWLLDKKL